MDTNTMKLVFGSMPLNHLPAAQIIAKKTRNRNLIIAGLAATFVIGVVVGVRYVKRKNQEKQVSPINPYLSQIQNTDYTKRAEKSSGVQPTSDSKSIKPEDSKEGLGDIKLG